MTFTVRSNSAPEVFSSCTRKFKGAPNFKEKIDFKGKQRDPLTEKSKHFAQVFINNVLSLRFSVVLYRQLNTARNQQSLSIILCVFLAKGAETGKQCKITT